MAPPLSFSRHDRTPGPATQGMRLSDLLEAVGMHGRLHADPSVVDVTEDSREVQPGWLFVAIPGHQEDGARYAEEALKRGAVGVVAEHPLPLEATTILVSDARRFLGLAAATINGHPSRRIPVFGLTGTDGKTTTCYLLRAVLEAGGTATGMMTTVETTIGRRSARSEGRMTTPSASHIQRSLRHMVEAGDQAAVMEISSHALAQERVTGTTLQSAAVTNIAADHLDYHGSIDAYADTKARIFDLVAHSSAGPVGAVNADDPISAQRFGKRKDLLRFGIEQAAGVRGTILGETDHSIRCSFRYCDSEAEFSLPTVGQFNVSNALAAASLGLLFGYDLATVASGLEQATLPAGRLQKIEAKQGFEVFVDYAHTEQAFGSVMKDLKARADRRRGRIIAVFGAAGDRDRAKRPVLARLAAGQCHFFVITNEDPFSEDPSSIMAEVASGAPRDLEGRQWVLEPDRETAIRMALERARPGDIVVVTGKGHEQSIATRAGAIPWSDADVIRRLLDRTTIPAAGQE